MSKFIAIKGALQSAVRSMCEVKELYVRRPGVDFTRHRKLDFETIVWIMLKWGAGTLRKELLDCFSYAPTTPTPSALVEQREKMLPEAFLHLFYALNEMYPCRKTYKGLHIQACDGTYLPIAPDPDDHLTYVSRTSTEEKAHAMLRLTVLYDLLEGRYTNLRVEPMRGKHEGGSLIEMIDAFRGPGNTLTICDRGYEAWNVIAHFCHAELPFLMRVKDPKNPGGTLQGLPVPKDGDFDKTITVTLSHSKSREAKSSPGYKYINKATALDFLDAQHTVFTMKLRVVQFTLPNGNKETLITNLPEEEFTTEDLRILYEMRWGVETSFSTLKYSEGLLDLHSRTPSFILQEIFARFVIYNFDALILHSLDAPPPGMRYNQAASITIIRAFLRGRIRAGNLESQLKRLLLPIRKIVQHHPRRIRSKPARPFRYRAS